MASIVPEYDSLPLNNSVALREQIATALVNRQLVRTNPQKHTATTSPVQPSCHNLDRFFIIASPLG
jgi:hypothetical protein